MRKKSSVVTPQLIAKVEKSKKMLDPDKIAEIRTYIARALFRYGWKPSEIEEAAQDIICHKILPNYSGYSKIFELSTWVYKITLHYIIDDSRSTAGKQRMKTTLVTFSSTRKDACDEADNLSEQKLIKQASLKLFDEQEEAVDTKNARVVLKTALSTLKPKYRVLIELRFFEQLSYKEIGERTALPLGTVKAKLFRAKEMLRKLLLPKKDLLY